MSSEIDYEVNSSDCCGNGCANCILDIEPPRPTKSNFTNKINILLSYHSYDLLAIDEISFQIIKMHFKFVSETADSNLIVDISPGHHIMMRATPISPTMDTVTNSNITRPYSPFWSSADKLEFKILVNLAPDGIMSNYIKQLRPGDKVDFRGPVGIFKHTPDDASYANLWLFCHGVAIAPIFGIVNEILCNEDDMTRITVFACFENLKKILFRQELYDFQRFWNFQSRFYLSRPEENFENALKYKENVFGRRLDEEEIRQAIEKYQNIKTIKAVICGSKGFQSNLSKILLKLGIEKDSIDIL